MTLPSIRFERSAPSPVGSRRRRRSRRALPATLVVGALAGTAAGLLLAVAGSHGDESRVPVAVVDVRPAPPEPVELEMPTVASRPAYLIIQDEIDRALGERRP